MDDFDDAVAGLLSEVFEAATGGLKRFGFCFSTNSRQVNPSWVTEGTLVANVRSMDIQENEPFI